MPSRVITEIAGHVLLDNAPRTIARGQLLGILLEIQSGSQHAVGNSPVLPVVGKVPLFVPKERSSLVNPEVRARYHRNVVWIRRMKQLMKVCEAGAALHQRGEIWILDGALIVHIFQHNDDDA